MLVSEITALVKRSQLGIEAAPPRAEKAIQDARPKGLVAPLIGDLVTCELVVIVRWQRISSGAKNNQDYRSVNRRGRSGYPGKDIGRSNQSSAKRRGGREPSERAI